MKRTRKLYFDYASYMKAKKRKKANKKAVRSNLFTTITTDLRGIQNKAVSPT